MASTKQAKMGKVDCMVSWEVKITEQTLALIVFFFFKVPRNQRHKDSQSREIESRQISQQVWPRKKQQIWKNKFQPSAGLILLSL